MEKSIICHPKQMIRWKAKLQIQILYEDFIAVKLKIHPLLRSG